VRTSPAGDVPAELALHRGLGVSPLSSLVSASAKLDKGCRRIPVEVAALVLRSRLLRCLARSSNFGAFFSWAMMSFASESLSTRMCRTLYSFSPRVAFSRSYRCANPSFLHRVPFQVVLDQRLDSTAGA